MPMRCLEIPEEVLEFDAQGDTERSEGEPWRNSCCKYHVVCLLLIRGKEKAKAPPSNFGIEVKEDTVSPHL